MTKKKPAGTAGSKKKTKKKAPTKPAVKKSVAAAKKKTPLKAAEKKTPVPGAKKKTATKKGSLQKATVKKTAARKILPADKNKSSRPAAGSITPPIEKVFLPNDWNNTEKIILARRSTRAYQKKQVPEQMVRRIIECGRYSPSEGNYQPWRFIVIRDQKMLKEMEADAQKMIAKIWNVVNYRDHPWRKYHTKVFEYLAPSMLHPIPSGAIEAVAQGKFNVFWGAPMMILILKDKRGIGNPDLNVGIVGTNMVLAAHSMGLGTCWIGISRVLAYYKKWRRLFNIRHPWALEEALLVGFPIGDPDGFVHRDTHKIDWFDDNGHKVVR